MKKRTMNELRQTKEYQGSSEGRKYLEDLETPEDRKDKRNAYHKQHIERDYIAEAKIEIIDKITRHFRDNSI